MNRPSDKRVAASDGHSVNLDQRSTINWPLILILFLAGLLRFYEIGASSLWSDEGNTWALLGRSFGQIARDAAADIHPPGYYWLLKIWTLLFGANAVGMRSLSAVAGIALVWVIYQLSVQLCKEDQRWPVTALLAACLAALNPFQIYYSQEARMYMLLALESAGLFWALLALMHAQQHNSHHPIKPSSRFFVPALFYLVCGIAGLWTHYSFPIVLAAACLAYLWQTIKGQRQKAGRKLLFFVLLNGIGVLAFAPWLPTALDRIRHWPKGGAPVTALAGLQTTLQTLTLGPFHQLAAPPWFLLSGLLPLVGLLALRRQPNVVALALWMLAPVGLMLGLGLFSDAFLKFLLIASPAWCIAVAAVPQILYRRPYPVSRILYPLLCTLLIAGALILAAFTLPTYYTNPTARDNYAGVARYIQATGDATTDLVLLDAPGQQEVWRYYDPGFPSVALPQQRPPNPEQTVAALAAAVQTRRNVYALFWATDEADPAHIVEQWLDQNAFKGLESWQGNLRFAVYRLPTQVTCTGLTAVFDQRIRLLAQCQPQSPQRIAAGEIALIGLQWQALTPIKQRYKVSVQLLDARQQVIAQHDSEPAGGSQPTDSWLPHTTISDNHGLNIPFGTPPGDYTLIAKLYDQANGQPLLIGSAETVPLGQLQVVRPQLAIPVDILPILNWLHTSSNGVMLLGYDLYRKDAAHAPATPIQPGDLVHFTFYWQAPDPLPTDWAQKASFQLKLGQQTLSELLVPNYPLDQWQAGDLLRGEFDLPFDGTDRTPMVEFAGIKVNLKTLPGK
ncbi:MAG: glycosyltransferase family 39 protein [Chloroflexi bacterium]|nr:glycosyltransferase family 39 protein [Chloroflexota bacterium]